MDAAALDVIAAEAFGTLQILAIASARMLGVVAIFPLFVRFRIGFTIGAALAVALALPVMGPVEAAVRAAGEVPGGVPGGLWLLALLVAKEAGVGILVGLLVGLPFWAIQAAGDIVDTQRDALFGGDWDESAGGQSSAFATFLAIVAFLLFLGAGGLGTLVEVHYRSYAAWPLGAWLPEDGTAATAFLAATMQRILVLGLMVAAPFVVLFILIDVSVLALTRLAPNFGTEQLAPLAKNIAFPVAALLYTRHSLPEEMHGLLPSALSIGEGLRLLAP